MKVPSLSSCPMEPNNPIFYFSFHKVFLSLGHVYSVSIFKKMESFCFSQLLDNDGEKLNWRNINRKLGIWKWRFWKFNESFENDEHPIEDASRGWWWLVRLDFFVIVVVTNFVLVESHLWLLICSICGWIWNCDRFTPELGNS